MTYQGTSISRETKSVVADAGSQRIAPPTWLRRRWVWLVVLGVLAVGVYRHHATSQQHAAATSGPPRPAVSVVAVTAREGDMPVYLTGLGSVTAYNTVAVKSRVDG